MWPTENTAFLVIHGNGVHRQYETLDKFVSKFYTLLQNLLHDSEIVLEHKLDDKARSYVRFKRNGYPCIDFYEYYWDQYMVRDITEKEVKDWIKHLDDGIKMLETDEIEILPGDYNAPLLLKVFKGGWLRIVLNLFLNKIIWLTTDVAIYCLHNQRSSYYEIRENVLSNAVNELIALVKSSENYERIIVVGHSLGTVIAYDALNRIAQEMSKQSPSLEVSQVQRIKGLVTFGSFLDMVALFFQEHIDSQNYIEKLITLERHAFRKPASGYKDNPIKYDTLNVKWLNFYHPDDVAANRPLFCYELNKDDQIDVSRKFSNTSKPKFWESLLYKIWTPKFFKKYTGALESFKKSMDVSISHLDWESLLYKVPTLKSFKESVDAIKSFKKSMDAHGSYWENDQIYLCIICKLFYDTEACAHSK